jgi:hypothetical protein
MIAADGRRIGTHRFGLFPWTEKRRNVSMKALLWIPLLLANIAFGQTSIPTLTDEQWRQDLGYFVKEVTTKHANPYHFTSKAQFDQAVSELRERIPSMKNYEVVVGLQHLAALVGDGTHLSIREVCINNFRWRFSGSVAT